MKQHILIILTAMAVLAGCSSDGGFLVEAEFKNTQDIKAGTAVYLGSKKVGSVKDSSNTEYGATVSLDLDPDAAELVNTRAAVVLNRLRQGSPLELHNPPGPIRQPLQAGQSIEALDSMTQLVGWGIGSSMKAGAESVEAFKEYLQSDEFDRDKAELGIAIDEGLRLAKDGVKEAEKTISEALKEIELTEEEMAEVVHELGQELAPVAQELAQGGTELMLELEKLAMSLEQSNPETGEALLQSFDDMLKQFGDSIDEGVEQAFEEEAPLKD